LSGFRHVRTPHAPAFALLSSGSFATALLADAPPNHPSPCVKKTHAGESEMRNFSEAFRTLNTPDATHHCLHERYGAA